MANPKAGLRADARLSPSPIDTASSPTKVQPVQKIPTAHIAILGAGIGGTSAAYELHALLDSTHRITVVNAADHFQFVPSNPWLAVGWRERETITFPICPYLDEKGIEFVAQPVQRIDGEGN